MGALDYLRFDPDPLGVSQEFKYDPHDDILVVRSVQDVEPILKHNRSLRREADEGNNGYSPSRELRRVASVPNVVIHQWLMEGVNVYRDDDWPEIAARLDSPDFSHFRTAPGRISQRSVRAHPTTRSW